MECEDSTLGHPLLFSKRKKIIRRCYDIEHIMHYSFHFLAVISSELKPARFDPLSVTNILNLSDFCPPILVNSITMVMDIQVKYMCV